MNLRFLLVFSLVMLKIISKNLRIWVKSDAETEKVTIKIEKLNKK